ncbi:MAG: glycosyltransferase, partial [Desulfobacteraceae bacterium]
MHLEKTIGVVVPAYNEEKLISKTLIGIPPLVDRIVVIDDASTDNTANLVKEMSERDERIELVQHEVNQGVGGAIITGYKRCRDL